MKLNRGQIWIDSRRPSFAYRITNVDYESLDCRSCICELWFQNGTDGTLNYVSGGYSVITYQNEFHYWRVLYDLT